MDIGVRSSRSDERGEFVLEDGDGRLRKGFSHNFDLKDGIRMREGSWVLVLKRLGEGGIGEVAGGMIGVALEESSLSMDGSEGGGGESL
jgi:hypothetical protein